MSNCYRMTFLLAPDKLELTPEVLKPHWALKRFKLVGDSIVAFRGGVKLSPEQYVDLLEAQRERPIPNVDLLHFVVEHFDDDLERAILKENILINIAQEKILHRAPKSGVMRWGDNLYDGKYRLTISCATKTLVSAKIHLGICIDSDEENGYHGISEFGIDPFELAEVVANQYRADMRRLKEKCWHLRPMI